MEKYTRKRRRISALRTVVLTDVFKVFLVFGQMIFITAAPLCANSIHAAKDALHADHIARQTCYSGETGENMPPFYHDESRAAILPVSAATGTERYPPVDTPPEHINRDAYRIPAIIAALSALCLFLIALMLFFRLKKVLRSVRMLTRFAEKKAAACVDENGNPAVCLSLPPRPGDNVSVKSEAVALQKSFLKLLRVLRGNLDTVEKRVKERTLELRRSNNYIKQLIENSSNISILLDTDMNLLYCSNSILRLTCRDDISGLIGKPLTEALKNIKDPFYLERSRHRMSRIFSGEVNVLKEDEAITWPNGEHRLYRITYKRVTDDDGSFDGSVVVMEDVTELRLEEAERRVNDLIRSTLSPCMIWNETGDVVAYNDEASRMFGMPLGLPPEDFGVSFMRIHPERQNDGTDTEAIRQDLIREALDKGFARLNIWLGKSDKTLVCVDVSAARISWLSGWRLVVYFHDMTAIRAMEAEAKEATERTQIMLDGAPMICILRDENNNVIDCNQEALNIFGVSDKSYFIKNFYNFYPEYQPDGSRSLTRAREIIQTMIQNGVTDNFEWLFITAGGEPLLVETKFLRIRWKDTYRILSYSRDLRQIKANEQNLLASIEMSRQLELQKEAAQAASEAKSRFLANMSHEIRTPMNAVLGMLELLLSEDLNIRQLRYVEDIKTSATALLEIIDDILDISKIQAGKLNLVPVHYDFGAFLASIGSITQFLAREKHLAFTLDIQSSLPKCLYGDELRLRQILLNILSNAVKFTREGQVRLAVDATDTKLNFSVSDTGIGIKENDIPKLFEAFEQVDMRRNQANKGTGLGLSITKVLVEMMGGEITLESVYGRGTTFYVTIQKVPGDESQIQNKAGDDDVFFAPDAKILVVDDNPINLKVVSGLLELYKITAETVASGPEAIELVPKNQYDIVFMDHMMPEMDGLEAAKIIREMGSNVPIVAFTANAIAGTREMLLAAGMNDYLSKPVIKSVLNQILKKWIPSGKLVTRLKDTQAESAVNDAPAEIETEGLVEFWEKIESIKEVSLDTGLERTAGRRDIFEQSLRLVIKEIEKCAANLRNFLEAQDMGNFVIEAHSMKSSLANIGAMDLSGKAKELEDASSRGDKDFCARYMPPFLDRLENLKLEIGNAFAARSKDFSEIKELPPELPPILSRLTLAFNAMDFQGVADEMEALDALNFSGALKDEIEAIKDAVLMMDYESASEVIRKLSAV